jgi:hypothetical protein
VYQPHATKIRGCRKSGDVANHASADGHQNCMAVRTGGYELPGNLFNRGEILRRLTVIE